MAQVLPFLRGLKGKFMPLFVRAEDTAADAEGTDLIGQWSESERALQLKSSCYGFNLILELVAANGSGLEQLKSESKVCAHRESLASSKATPDTCEVPSKHFQHKLSQKNPRAHKNKIGTSPPPPKPKLPPPPP